MNKKLSILAFCVTAVLAGCQDNDDSLQTQTSSSSPNELAATVELPAFCAATAQQSPLSAETKASQITDQYVFVEGPVWDDKNQVFYFSEMDFDGPQDSGPRSIIHRLRLPDQLDVFIDNSGSNGIAIDGQRLIATTHDSQTVSSYDIASKKRDIVVSDFEGKHFNSPNDIAVSARGDMYFTDPDWQLGTRPKQTGMTGVYWRDRQGDVHLVDGERGNPNGISLSPDQTFLYVGENNGTISRYPVNQDGSVGERADFAHVPEPDGMAVDCAGNIYIASHGPGKLVMLSPEGQQLTSIDIAPRATNVSFGGAEHKTILVTAGGGLYTLPSPIAGFPY
ncbi:SMP-30/gluconolactonase/LRE family protein [Neptunicella sp. SCSIO 80796]|uniref:SMP-30/gluconolactonase/LRE family protein n=1 Tax=Neptunicella plasticusilytica TaxID=3117012 RepID=UPI003A4D8EE8